MRRIVEFEREVARLGKLEEECSFELSAMTRLANYYYESRREEPGNFITDLKNRLNYNYNYYFYYYN